MSSSSILGFTDLGTESIVESSQILHELLKPSAGDSSNWLSGDVALHLESIAKLEFALQYCSKLIKEHPRWPDQSSTSSIYCMDVENHQEEKLLENFQQKFYTGLATLGRKFSLHSFSLISMVS